MKTIAASVLVLAACAAPASAAIVISSGVTSRMNCSGGVCTPTSKNAVLNVGDLQAMLASGDVTVETANGAETIGITAPLTWASTSRLTLSSSHSVSFKAAVVVEGTAGLALVTDKGQPGGDVLFYPGGSVTFWDTASSLSIDGTAYTLVGDLPALASATTANSSGAYALAKDYDASADGSYDRSPVGTLLRGRFEGLGHSISNLGIDLSHTGKNIEVALFHATGPKGIVRDIALTNIAITAAPDGSEQAAALVAENNGAIVNSSATGSIDATHSGGQYGGLVFVAETNSRILNSSSSVSITTDPTRGAQVGGLAEINKGSISNSYATGTLTGVALGGLVYDNNGPNAAITGSHATASLVFAGGDTSASAGLALFNEGTISNSYASGSFTGNLNPGGMAGLVGTNAGAIASSWSSSSVTIPRGGTVAGLVITNTQTGTIVNSYATGNLSAGSNGSGGASLGGFIIINEGSISQSYETGSVTDAGAVEKNSIGAFAAVNEGTIANSYAFGAVSGNRKAYTGGFVGSLEGGSITASYSTGLVSGGRNPNTQGFVAFVSSGTVTNGYWDVDTSGQNKSKAGTPISDAALKAALPAGLDAAVWAQDASVNNGYPYLIANPPH